MLDKQINIYYNYNHLQWKGAITVSEKYGGTPTTNEELNHAIRAVEIAYNQFNNAYHQFVTASIYKLSAALERLNALHAELNAQRT